MAIKHKGGYELLKEKYEEEVREHQALETKYAALVKERDELQMDLDFALEKAKKERDEWKAKYDSLNERHKNLLIDHDAWKKSSDEWKAKFECKSSPVFRANEKLGAELVDTEEKLAFLLKHCPFWVRWKYRKQFEKGGKE